MLDARSLNLPGAPLAHKYTIFCIAPSHKLIICGPNQPEIKLLNIPYHFILNGKITHECSDAMMRPLRVAELAWVQQSERSSHESAQSASSSSESAEGSRAAEAERGAEGKRFKPDFACNCPFELRCRSDFYCQRRYSQPHRCLFSCCGLHCATGSEFH